MMDHGQLGPPTPMSAVMLSPVESRRPSFSDTRPRRSSMKELESHPRRSSSGEYIATSTLRRASQTRSGMGSFTSDERHKPALEGAAISGRGLSDSLSMSALEDDSDPDEPTESSTAVKNEKTNGGFAHPNDISAELYANPTLAALRSAMGGLSMTPLQTSVKQAVPTLPPILANPKCSGYFVEPVGASSFITVQYVPYDTLTLDEVDGTFSGKWRGGGKDNMS
jgi:dual specificity phosphatase 12